MVHNLQVPKYPSPPVDRPLVALITDFGQSEYVAAVKAAIWRECPDCRVVDVYHGVHHGSVLQGAHVLVKSVSEMPEAIHVVIVDPGVGTERRAVVVFAGALRIMGPDNGVLEPAVRRDGDVVVRVLDIPEGGASPLFHGRDVFGPAAARLARGDDPTSLTRAGQALMPLPAYGHDRFGERVMTRIVHIDVFGNVQTPVPASEVPDLLTPGRELTLWLADKAHPARVVRTYSDLSKEELGVLTSSSGHVEVAQRAAPAALTIGARVGDELALDAS